MRFGKALAPADRVTLDTLREPTEAALPEGARLTSNTIGTTAVEEVDVSANRYGAALLDRCSDALPLLATSSNKTLMLVFVAHDRVSVVPSLLRASKTSVSGLLKVHARACQLPEVPTQVIPVREDSDVNISPPSSLQTNEYIKLPTIIRVRYDCLPLTTPASSTLIAFRESVGLPSNKF